MDSITINPNGNYSNKQSVSDPIKTAVIPPMPSGNRASQTSFKGEQISSVPATTARPLNLRTELSTKEEQEKFIALASVIEPKDRKALEIMLKSGILLNTKSNDKSSTLDNLYKIISTERAPGIDPKKALSETINAIVNPFAITQNFGDIPKPYVSDIIQKAQANPKTPNNTIDEKSIKVEHSSACVSASIEFNLATQMPAEFARFAEGLTSPKMSVDKTINLKNLTENTLDSVWLLNTFEVPYLMKDFNTATVRLAPDKNASIRAQIQNNHKDELERSLIDVLMQSTFMNVGSQQTYDSLTDNRGGKFNWDNKGLIEFEKTFTESIVQDKNKISVTYQNLDENGKLTGYTTDFETIKKNILDSLAIGENVIIGYTQLDKDNKVANGHEITIIGSVKDKQGNLLFVCNDTDDNNPEPIIYPADFIIPKIHHAGLPNEIAAKDSQFTETWKEGLKAYKEAKSTEGQTQKV